MTSIQSFFRNPVLSILAGLVAANQAGAQVSPAGDSGRGKIYFQTTCALCHTTSLGPGNTVIVKQGPSLVGVLGRRAASGLGFNYTKALSDSGLVWDAAALDHFLTNPLTAVPGTTMPMPVPDGSNRLDLIAYLTTLKVPAGVTPTNSVVQITAASVELDAGAWQHAAPGVKHHITLADLPPPFKTTSEGNNPRVVRPPAEAALSVPPGFTVRLFATGFTNPRLLRTAPNGDIFLAETGARRIRVLRAADGTEAPSENQIFAEGLDRPFGIAFYPAGDNPQWVYVANNNSVVRFPYHNGDLKAGGEAQVIIPHLSDGGGGHSTRDVAFSRAGRRLLVSVGAGSNGGGERGKKNLSDIPAWEAEHALGAAWGPEARRANILVTDPEGQAPLHAFATGVRNGVSLAVNPD